MDIEGGTEGGANFLASLGPDELGELMGMQSWWQTLSPLQRTYYKTKAKYYVKMTRETTFLGVAGALAAVGIATYILSESPVYGVAMIVVGVLLGVIAVWEIQRK